MTTDFFCCQETYRCVTCLDSCACRISTVSSALSNYLIETLLLLSVLQNEELQKYAYLLSCYICPSVAVLASKNLRISGQIWLNLIRVNYTKFYIQALFSLKSGNIIAYFWHFEDRASWYIRIIEANKMHSFSSLFWYTTLHISDRVSENLRFCW